MLQHNKQSPKTAIKSPKLWHRIETAIPDSRTDPDISSTQIFNPSSLSVSYLKSTTDLPYGQVGHNQNLIERFLFLLKEISAFICFLSKCRCFLYFYQNDNTLFDFSRAFDRLPRCFFITNDTLLFLDFTP